MEYLNQCFNALILINFTLSRFSMKDLNIENFAKTYIFHIFIIVMRFYSKLFDLILTADLYKIEILYQFSLKSLAWDSKIHHN
jgi:hypothetical protein